MAGEGRRSASVDAEQTFRDVTGVVKLRPYSVCELLELKGKWNLLK
jgi:hypothetical protein